MYNCYKSDVEGKKAIVLFYESSEKQRGSRESPNKHLIVKI